MKPRSLIVTAIGVILSAIAAISAVINYTAPEANITDPSQGNFDQPSIGKDPPAYRPLFKPSKQPGCDGPNCPQ